jgi:uncharacterized membrane protein YgdD (TMEM256/DUF423 family)
VTSRRVLLTAALLLALATLCGALGAHGLNGRLGPERLALWDTAVRYHFLQSLGLMGIGLSLHTRDDRALRASAALIAAGIALFCGTLYALSLGAPHRWGTLIPLGGLAWIVGWVLFAYGIWRHRSKEQSTWDDSPRA